LRSQEPRDKSLGRNNNERRVILDLDVHTCDIVDKRRLTHGVLIFCGGVAPVVATLGATNEAAVRVNLLGSIGRVWEAELVEGGSGEGRDPAILCKSNCGKNKRAKSDAGHDAQTEMEGRWE
jgi:hypothetical protein